MRLGLRSYNIPRVFEVPGPLHLEHLLTRLVDIKTADKHDFWIPTCKWSYDQYVKSGISEDKLFLTYYGGDINYTEHKTGVLRKDYNISNDKYIVAMVAYMYAPKKWLGQKRGIKGHEDFIDAVSLLQKKYPQIQGVCIGGAWDGAVEYEKSVRAYSESVGANIIFTGTRKDVGDLYQDINCVVHPSHSENLGGAGESLLLGVPTIASSVGGFPDIVINNRTGLLVPAKSPSAIAKAIETMLLSPERARAMAIEGQKYVNELLDVKNTSKSVFDFYCKIVEMYENL
jgi:glycosyltransferase involved in cell wall biosynthesis